MIEGDAFRAFHPDYDRLLNEDPIAMPQATAAAAGAWTGMAITAGLEAGTSLLVEGTWRNPEIPLREMTRGQELGYHTTAAVVSVPPAMSWMGAMDRYHSAAMAGGPARFTPPEAHEVVVSGLPDSVGLIAGAACTDSFLVLDRGGHVRFEGALPGPERGQAGRSAFEQGFRAGPDEQQRAQLAENLERCLVAHELLRPEQRAPVAAWQQLHDRLLPHLGDRGVESIRDHVAGVTRADPGIGQAAGGRPRLTTLVNHREAAEQRALPRPRSGPAQGPSAER